MSENIHIMREELTNALSEVDTTRNELSEMMSNEDMLDDVKVTFESFNEYCNTFQNVHMSYMEELSNLKELDVDDRIYVESKRYDEKLNTIVQFKVIVLSWVNKVEHLVYDRSLVERTKLAELLVEKSMFKYKQSLIAKQRELELDMEIAKIKARENVHDGLASKDTSETNDGADRIVSRVSFSTAPISANINSLTSTTASPEYSNTVPVFVTSPITSISVTRAHNVSPTVACTSSIHSPIVSSRVSQGISNFTEHGTSTVTKIIPSETGNVDRNGFSETVNVIQQLLSSQTQLINAMSLPQPQVPIFSGEVMKYTPFIMSFDARITPRVVSDADRLYYLDQHLQGEPKKLISGCLYMDPKLGYSEARRLLDKHYGDAYTMANAYVNELSLWPPISDDDVIGLRHLSFFLIKCRNAMSGIIHMHVLNHPTSLQSIVRKLPEEIQDKWRTHVADMRTEHHIPTFSDLVNFVDQESDAANDPVFGQEALSKCIMSTRTDTTSKCFAMNIHGYNTSSAGCLYRGMGHDLDECASFAQKAVRDRKSFLMSRYVCFGCYCDGHIVRDCVNKRRCMKCGKPHPTALHMDNFRYMV